MNVMYSIIFGYVFIAAFIMVSNLITFHCNTPILSCNSDINS